LVAPLTGNSASLERNKDTTMNQFHHTNIGERTTTWRLSSVSAARAALETLQLQLFTSVERIDATCRECNAVEGQSTVISSVKALAVL
jgi:hypothetical protein